MKLALATGIAAASLTSPTLAQDGWPLVRSDEFDAQRSDRPMWGFAERKADAWWTAASHRPRAPFDRPFHPIINLAIGGKLPEARGLGGVLADGYPQRMGIAWVRVFSAGQAGPDHTGKGGN